MMRLKGSKLVMCLAIEGSGCMFLYRKVNTGESLLTITTKDFFSSQPSFMKVTVIEDERAFQFLGMPKDK